MTSSATIVGGQRRKPCRVCGATPARPYLRGWLCAACEPAQAYVDPEWTAEAMRARKEARIGRQVELARPELLSLAIGVLTVPIFPRRRRPR